ncbi:MAG: DinB family protein [Bacteroidetes bacterium]|nr:DinB family protein [Bacteroidota bacterium]
MPTIARPTQTEYPVYYHTYISKAEGNDLIALLKKGNEDLQAFISSLPAHKADYRYQPDKWSVKEILIHLMDAERIFAYRALRFSRGDRTGLPGFDENEYVPNCDASSRSIENILTEYQALRASSISFFENLTHDMLIRNGIANGEEVSVRALAYIIAGHEVHHLSVIKERYL